MPWVHDVQFARKGGACYCKKQHYVGYRNSSVINFSRCLLQNKEI
jgi:hypothetical protein